MEIIVFLSIVIAVVAVLTSIVLVRRVKKQIAEMTDVLVDVKNGNGNRRILSATNELTAPLAYEINEIVVAYESRLSTVRQTEETNRQLMTSLSHDVRTPLTTLLGCRSCMGFATQYFVHPSASALSRYSEASAPYSTQCNHHLKVRLHLSGAFLSPS